MVIWQWVLRVVRELMTLEMPKISFLKGNSWVICFKLLSYSPKPLNQSFSIKIQLNSIVFHSINISKAIFNSFHWFWSLNYVFGDFMFIVGIFSNGSWNMFRLRWVPNFGDHHNYSCLSCFDHWWCVLYTFPRECLFMHWSCISNAH